MLMVGALHSSNSVILYINLVLSLLSSSYYYYFFSFWNLLKNPFFPSHFFSRVSSIFSNWCGRVQSFKATLSNCGKYVDCDVSELHIRGNMRTANLQREFQQFIIINDTSIAPFFLYSWGNQNECLVCCCTRANDVRYVTHIDLVRQVPLLCFLHVQRHLTCFLFFFFFFFLSFLFLALHLHTHTQILFLFFLSLWKAVEKGVYGLELLTRKYQIFFFLSLL